MGIFSAARSQSYRIEVSARASVWVLEDPWHPRQRVKRRGDGSVELTVPAAHDMEVIPRVLALGTEAQILSPVTTRRRIAEMTRKMASAYADES